MGAWTRNMYIDVRNSDDSTGLGRCSLGIWKLRDVGKDAENVSNSHVTKIKTWFIYY